MRKKNLFLLLLAMVLVCAISVTGTMAYLKGEANDGKGVVNIFMASGGGIIIETDGIFTLQEHEVTQAADGTYTKGTNLLPTDTKAGNSYNLLPGTEVPKDPFITLKGKTAAPAYLYLEVVGTDNFTAYDDATKAGSDVTYALTDKWEELTGVTGANGGKVYVYKVAANNYIVDDKTFADSYTIQILQDNQIVVGKNLNIAKDINLELKFYAYLAQSTVMTKDAEENDVLTSDKAVVYTTCFPYEVSATQ